MAEYQKVIGLGVAGNFAGHLEQAKEAESFQNVKTKEQKQPKGIFPFYVPGTAGFLSVYPLVHDRLQFPKAGGNVQIEPEVGILFQIEYKNQRVVALRPLSFGAYNDCSIRNPQANKISQKKNWGAYSKGVSARMIPIDKFSLGGIMDRFWIACYLRRGNQWIEYGVNSPVKGYNYFYEQLLEWLVVQMNEQTDQDPLEPILPYLKEAGFPTQALISVGATQYTPFGESNFLQPGDQSIVLVYDGEKQNIQQILSNLEKGKINQEGVSPLIQHVI